MGHVGHSVTVHSVTVGQLSGWLVGHVGQSGHVLVVGQSAVESFTVGELVTVWLVGQVGQSGHVLVVGQFSGLMVGHAGHCVVVGQSAGANDVMACVTACVT